LCDSSAPAAKDEPVQLALQKRDVTYVSWREYNMAYFGSHENGGSANLGQCKELGSAGHALIKGLCPKSCGVCSNGNDPAKLIQEYLTAECKLRKQ